MLISRKSVKDGEFAWFRNLSQADQQCKKLCGLRQNTQGVLNALRKAWAHGYLLAFYWRFWQLPPQATLVKRARYAKLAKPLSFKVLRQVVENTVGDVVQLVRTLPRHWLESHTVTAVLLLHAIINISPHQGVQFSNQKPHSTCLKSFFPYPEGY